MVTIGKQRWTQINYHGAGGYDLTPAGSATDWGKLYSRDAAAAIALPAGWRMPSSLDYKALLSYIILNDGYADDSFEIYAELLASPTGWLYIKGIGQFNAYPYGDLQLITGHVYLPEQQGLTASFWTADSSTDASGNTYYGTYNVATHEYPSGGQPDQMYADQLLADTAYHYPVRFIKDVK